MAKGEAEPGGGVRMARIDRARMIRDAALAVGEGCGRWQSLELGEGRQARVWAIDAGEGWRASVSSRFSGLPQGSIAAARYDEALLLQLAPPRSDDVVLDVWVEPFGKVLSMGTTDGVDTLITMRPGPWEVLFGLDRREWAPSEARRLASGASSG